MTDEIGIPLYTLFQAVGLVMSLAILFFSLRGMISISSPEIILAKLTSLASQAVGSVTSAIMALV